MMNKIDSRNLNLIIILASLLGFLAYLFASRLMYKPGFPLDDAWIHQTFARNIVHYHEWSFNPGYPTAGSTSPLWTLLLTPAFIFHISPLIWAYLLGAIVLGIISVLLKNVVEISSGINGKLATLLVVIAISWEWHLLWAAASGMETLFFSLLMTVVVFLLSRKNPNQILTGLVIGLSIWVRPEGITMLGPVLLVVFLQDRIVLKKFLRSFSLVMLGIALLTIPYLIFNYSLSGSIWPNTLQAKQIEYQGLLQSNFWVRYLRLFMTPLVGANLILIPGFIYQVYNSFRDKEFTIPVLAIWILGFVFIYSIRLPVTYQHGRYLIPIIPIYLCVAIPGLIKLFALLNLSRVGSIIQKVWGLTLIILGTAFAFLGGKAYASDVAIIETQMVEPAKWIAENTPSDSLIAAHDIGAVGYFSGRYVIDLAGLVNKQVVPIVTNPQALKVYITEQRADYLMTFPDWYSYPLVDESQVVYKSRPVFVRNLGGQPMEIYLLQ